MTAAGGVSPVVLSARGRAGGDQAGGDQAGGDQAGGDHAAVGGDLAAFERFVEEAGPRLGRALAALYGFEDGRDATAEALAYAWENWSRLQHIANLPGYLFRVGQTRSRRRREPAAGLFGAGDRGEYRFEPGLAGALAALSQRQRLAVVLVHGYGCTLREVAELTGIRPTTVGSHLNRGLSRLRELMGVSDEG